MVDKSPPSQLTYFNARIQDRDPRRIRTVAIMKNEKKPHSRKSSAGVFAPWRKSYLTKSFSLSILITTDRPVISLPSRSLSRHGRTAAHNAARIKGFSTPDTPVPRFNYRVSARAVYESRDFVMHAMNRTLHCAKRSFHETETQILFHIVREIRLILAQTYISNTKKKKKEQV